MIDLLLFTLVSFTAYSYLLSFLLHAVLCSHYCSSTSTLLKMQWKWRAVFVVILSNNPSGWHQRKCLHYKLSTIFYGDKKVSSLCWIKQRHGSFFKAFGPIGKTVFLTCALTISYTSIYIHAHRHTHPPSSKKHEIFKN